MNGFTRRKLFFGIGAVCIALIIFGLGFVIGKNTTASPDALAQTTEAPTIKQEATINKSFTFPVFNKDGQKATDISYAIHSVDTQDQIIIKGQRAYAVAGRTFLIVNIGITNSSNQTVQLQSRDYVRLSTPQDKNLLAADIHNDPIVIQPISTENTRLGFPIDTNTKSIILHVGEINGSKTDIPVTFTR